MTTDTKPQAETRTFQMLIDGQSVNAKSGETFERINPANGSLFATCPYSGIEDVDMAVDAARRVFDSGKWSDAPAKQRHDVLRKVADSMRAEMLQLGALLAQEVGKPIGMAIAEISMAADVFEYFAGVTLDLKGESITMRPSSPILRTVPRRVLPSFRLMRSSATPACGRARKRPSRRRGMAVISNRRPRNQAHCGRMKTPSSWRKRGRG